MQETPETVFKLPSKILAKNIKLQSPEKPKETVTFEYFSKHWLA